MKLGLSVQGSRALTSIEAMFVVVLLMVLAVVTLMWLTANQGMRGRAERQKCANILKSMSLGYKVFANDNDDKFPFLVTNSLAFGNVTQMWHHFQAMSNELGSARILLCPSDRERQPNIRRDFSTGPDGLGSAGNAAVSYGGSLDAAEVLPNTILLIDRNLVTNAWNLSGSVFLAVSNLPAPAWDRQMHKLCGNASLADGSVQQLSAAGLAAQVRKQGIATNRLLLPLLP